MGYLITAFLSYLVGSSNLAFYIAKWRQKDLRGAGSGNYGASNATILLGWKAGIAAEVLTVPRSSIGRMIFESKLYLQTTDLFAWTLAVILLSVLIEKILMRLVARIGAQTPGGVRNA